MEKTYNSIKHLNNKFLPEQQVPGTLYKLPPGCYQVKASMREWWFEKMHLNFDKILNLPSDEFQFVTNQFTHFLKPETRAKFEKYGFLYKRSVLLHGLWGTGKSVITNRIAEEVIKDYGGVCLFVDDPRKIGIAFQALDSFQPETPIVIILEELDEILKHFEKELLVLLDGAVQKNNVMFLATTNYIKKIPKRILRPGRFGLVIEVKYPNTKARQMYFETKLGKDFSEISEFVKASAGLSVDELKEIVQSCVIFENSLKDTIVRIKATRENGQYDETYVEDEDQTDEEYEEEKTVEGLYQTLQEKLVIK